jgi:hypothetical protein
MKPRPLSLVIPVEDEPTNDTLAIALASVKRHVPWLHPVLIGNPLTLQQYLEPIEWTAPPALALPFLQPHPNDPVGNTTKMLSLALDDTYGVLITDPFVWSNDDIFFRGPVTLDDLYEAGATARGHLEEVPKAGRYGRIARRTADVLSGLRPARPTWNYERHVPLVVNKLDMRHALATADGGSPRSTYQNLRLDQPVAVAEDVKAFTEKDLATLPPGPIFSTGNRFPLEPLREFLASDTTR